MREAATLFFEGAPGEVLALYVDGRTSHEVLIYQVVARTGWSLEYVEALGVEQVYGLLGFFRARDEQRMRAQDG